MKNSDPLGPAVLMWSKGTDVPLPQGVFQHLLWLHFSLYYWALQNIKIGLKVAKTCEHMPRFLWDVLNIFTCIKPPRSSFNLTLTFIIGVNLEV